ncbi:MAG TPA: ATPase [Verrucomicrobiae bacterium]|nr:ATPase [Verrucomicrobiae bacterium]
MKYSTLCCVLMMAVCAEAAVVDSSANGFTVKITLHIQAPPAAVYQKLVRNVGDWWNPAHTFSGSARNLSIEERAMGCFCEKLADGGGVRHMEVVYLAPGKALVMTGALGPMQSLAAAGNLRVTFTPEDGGTKFEATYAVVGYLANGMNTFAAPADNMLGEQFTRLKSYIESAAK